MPTGRAADRLLPSIRRVVLVRETADRTDGQLLTAFLARHDADAFAALVRRHGPMVLGVCRRVVGDVHTADDAFQATFLVLARRAAAVRPREAVGNWLYGVAYRTAVKARAVRARRRARETQVDAMPDPPAPSRPDDVWTDLRPVIDEELARLPEKFRLPVVLCDLEGRPQRQVAKQLGLPPATLATRLASARRLLSRRLTRRGITLSGGALGTVLTGNASAALVSAKVADGLARAAEGIAVGGPVSGLVSAHAVQLSEGVMRMMLLAKLKAVAVTALTALALTGGLGFGLVPAHADGPPAATPAAAARPAKPAGPDDATFLRRLCLDLTGQLPTTLEVRFFLADADAAKRKKVLDWMLADDAVKAFLANKLGVPPDRVRLRAVAGEGLTVELDWKDDPAGRSVELKLNDYPVFVDVLNFDVSRSVGVNSDAGVTGSIVMNERTFDLMTGKVVQPERVNLNTVWQRQPAPDAVYSTYRRQRLTTADPPNAGWFVEPTRNAEIEYFLFTDGQPPATTAQPTPLTYDLVWRTQQPSDLTTLRVWVAESDADFLKRVVKEARGGAPTALEEKYFAEDKDPKKREKLLDLLLKDVAVAKKVGDDWKKRMLSPSAEPVRWSTTFVPSHERVWVNRSVTLMDLTRPQSFTVKAAPEPDRLEKLVGELLGAKKPDDAVLDGISLVAVGRLPTESEKRLTLAAVSKAADRRAAWVEVARALAGTAEGKKHATDLNKK